MFRIISLIICFFLFIVTDIAQINVRFVIQERPSFHKLDTIYVAGSFNIWNPSNKIFLFIPVDGAFIDLKLAPGNYEYKFTRGSWNKVEVTKYGKDLDNRTVNFTKDTVINIAIGGWKDDFTMELVVRKHTASEQVRIFDTAFLIPQLHRTRRMWVYLPEDYTSTQKKYPVLYMHDGQNLFDEAASGFGEWGVDEALDSLFRQGFKKCIVIGIDNGPKRMNEYNPYEFEPYGQGEGDKYVDFLARTLKPYIDKIFRTKTNKKNTFIAGSSMGGLISLYAVIKYPEIYGGAGIFSPAFWTAPALEGDLTKAGNKIKSKLFFYAGSQEGISMIPDMKKTEENIKGLSSSKIYERIDMEAKHNEASWRKYFPEFYKWMLN